MPRTPRTPSKWTWSAKKAQAAIDTNQAAIAAANAQIANLLGERDTVSAQIAAKQAISDF
jgi:hypothetical protein